MVHLQRLHEEYKAKGVVILGLDSSDTRDFALAFLKENGITFPSVVDSSADARDVYFNRYRGTSAPLNYVLDREGCVVAAFSGYAEDDRRGPEAVEAALARKAPEPPR